jgi:hypothetical protein
MFLNEEKLTDMLVKHKINVNQLHFMYLIYSGSSSLYRIAEEGKKFYRSEVEDLHKRGFIKNLNKGMLIENDQFEIDETTDQGKEILNFLNEDITMGDELWNVYPWSFMIGDKKIAAKTCDREMICEIYIKKIKGSIRKHREIVKHIKRGSALGLLTMGIEKFVRGEQWEYLAEEIAKNVSKKFYGTDEFA